MYIASAFATNFVGGVWCCCSISGGWSALFEGPLVTDVRWWIWAGRELWGSSIRRPIDNIAYRRRNRYHSRELEGKIVRRSAPSSRVSTIRHSVAVRRNFETLNIDASNPSSHNNKWTQTNSTTSSPSGSNIHVFRCGEYIAHAGWRLQAAWGSDDAAQALSSGFEIGMTYLRVKFVCDYILTAT